jgi:tRNA modification GTPase
MNTSDTICAISSPHGIGAISLIRMTGMSSVKILDKYFIPANPDKKFTEQTPKTIHLGNFVENEKIIDEVLVSFFKSPDSYTGEDMVEISCHGSLFIQSEILKLLISGGARMATPGEFTLRAFLNKKLDLSQAEAIADLIASNSKASHAIAIKQMKGGFSAKIKELRTKLIDFSSLIELELDFSEEDVEFVKRDELLNLLDNLLFEIGFLKDSFSVGNVIKNGVPVAIIGKPNVGKSTLLNVLLNDERALVSEIPGTTRDAIEDTIIISGVTFRFIDTAGLREPNDHVENLGIEKTYEKINLAKIILYVFDISETSVEEIIQTISDFKQHIKDQSKRLIIIANKIDRLVEIPKRFKDFVELETIFISAKRKENINLISESLIKSVSDENISEGTIVTNARHYEALFNARKALKEAKDDIESNVSNDLVAENIRVALHFLGVITGDVTNEEILGNIFNKFCIGK